MSDLAITNLFTDGDVVDATKFNTNYSDIVTYVNNLNSASSTWDAMSGSSASNVPLTVNNSTGTQDIVQMKDNGTTVLSVNDGGYVNMPYQDFAYAKYTSAPIYQSGAARLLSGFVVQTQTHSSMESGGRFTVVVPGKYLIAATVDTQSFSSATHVISLYIYKNGALIAKNVGLTKLTVSQSINITDIVNLTGGDYIDLYAEDAVDAFIAGTDSAAVTRCYVAKLS